MTFDSRLGDLIRRQRIARGWSQAELANRIVNSTNHAIKQSDISRIERGDIVLPGFERLEAISRVLDIPIGELIIAATRQRSEAIYSASEAADLPSDDAPPSRTTS